MIAGVETGGTKIIAAIAADETPDAIEDLIEIATTTPDDAAARLRGFLDSRGSDAPRHVGVAAFGPLDLDPLSPTFGFITATPKPGWSGTSLPDLLGPERSLSFVSDVTGAALGEGALGATAGVRDSAYVTVGTGIGVGALVARRPISEISHPELGHIAVRRHPHDRFRGVCPFHEDCAEGLASGPAIAARWGRPTRELGADLERAAELEAFYLAQLLAAVTYAYRPERIVLGGGATKIPGVLEATRGALVPEINGALGDEHPSRDPRIFIVPPLLGDLSGVHGALQLAAVSARSVAPVH
ncbi:ROK family protein [Microbacterium ulmi]|uniref:fructokinase n=1 Tax=Microbacterium ulmi TaxID=179095 RepID=A0A7Y2LZX5_9MICO|nr:fructokinase [Microbacterium ulmi]NNH03832.1 ROK family protein [Microbacterium ulmi]